jgi:DNA polymerase-1
VFGGRWRAYDYSSIEYRLLAHFAVGRGAQEVRAIFAKDPKADYHAIVGELIRTLTGLDLPRGKVKTINFGIIYGMALNALATALHIPKDEAAKLMEDYHAAAPYARATMDECANEVHRTGMVRTIMNRASDFNAWGSKEWQAAGREALSYEAACRKYGMFNIERQHTHKALNRKLQGSAADVMKKAMVDCWESGLFHDSACGVPILTVHDELDFEDLGDLDNPAWDHMQRTMESTLSERLSVPLLVDGGYGDTWKDCK